MPQTELTPTPWLLQAIETRRHLQQVVKAAEAELARATDDLKNELLAQGLDTADVGNYIVTLSVRERSSLDKGALVALGVSTDVIAKATKTSSYTQLDVREKKGEV